MVLFGKYNEWFSKHDDQDLKNEFLGPDFYVHLLKHTYLFSEIE